MKQLKGKRNGSLGAKIPYPGNPNKFTLTFEIKNGEQVVGKIIRSYDNGVVNTEYQAVTQQ